MKHQRLLEILSLSALTIIAAFSVFFATRTAGSLKPTVRVSASESARPAETGRSFEDDAAKLPQAYADEMIDEAISDEGILVTDDGQIYVANTDRESSGETDPMYDGMIIYQIQWGDTLSQLALDYHVRQDTLVRLNRIADPDLIYAGDYLIIPDMS